MDERKGIEAKAGLSRELPLLEWIRALVSKSLGLFRVMMMVAVVIAAIIVTPNLMRDAYVNKISCRISEGIFDDFYFKNDTGKVLKEVRVRLLLSGGLGTSTYNDVYWQHWAIGECKHLKYSPFKSVVRVKRVQLAGECDQGKIDLYWDN